MACGKKECDLKEYTNIEFCSEDFLSIGPHDKIDFPFVNCHREELEKLYGELEDEKSKKCMEAYLNQKISGNSQYLETLWTENQYYDEDLIVFEKISCMVDCGAYDGDSFLSFCKNYEKKTGKPYEGKALLMEPDEDNCQKLSLNIDSSKRVIIVKEGAWHEKSLLHFVRVEREPTSNKISEDGELSIAVNKIDNIVSECDRVDFIKMDIEGAELNALEGAKNTIEQYHPVLAVCVYHKKEDLLTIPQYIKSLYPGYKLYLRAHHKFSKEVVLYALPY